MKYLKRYKIFESLNLQDALSSIESHFSFEDIQEMFEDWVDIEVDEYDSDEYEDKMHYYELNGNGTAESDVCDDIINWYVDQGNDLDDSEKVVLRNTLYSKYFLKSEDLRNIKRNVNKTVIDPTTGILSLHIKDLSTLHEVNNATIQRISLFVPEFDYNKYKDSIPNIKNITISSNELLNKDISITGDFDIINTIIPLNKLTINGEVRTLSISSKIEIYDIKFAKRINLKYESPSKETIDYLYDKCDLLVSSGKLIKINDKEKYDLVNAIEKITLDFDVVDSGENILSVQQCLVYCYTGKKIGIRIPNNRISTVSKILNTFEYLDFDMTCEDDMIYLYYNKTITI